MAEESFDHRGVQGFVLTVLGDDSLWLWVYRVDHLNLRYSGDQKFTSDLAAFADGLRAAHEAIDRLLDADGIT